MLSLHLALISARNTKLYSILSHHRLFSPIASQGARRLDFVVLSWNTPALDFYRKKDVNILEDWNVGQLHLVKK